MEEPEVKESQEGAENSKDASSTGKEGAEESKDTSSTSNGNKSDEEVLEQVAANATSAAAQLESYKLDRSQKYMKLYDELMTKIDNHENKPEQTAATEQLKAAEAKEEVILSIEEGAKQQYGNAVVKEESEKYNVVVLSEKLDAKGAPAS